MASQERQTSEADAEQRLRNLSGELEERHRAEMKMLQRDLGDTSRKADNECKKLQDRLRIAEGKARDAQGRLSSSCCSGP